MFKPALVLLLTLFSTKVLAEPAPRKVAVIDGITFKSDGRRTTVREADHFYKVLSQVLGEKGWEPLAPIPASLCGPSSAGDCLGYVAREAKADYVLRVTGTGNLTEGYSLRIEVYSQRTKHSQKTNNVCDICMTDDIARSTGSLSLGLLADATKDDADTEKDRDQRSRMQPGEKPGRELTSMPAVPESTHLAWAPWAMIGIGAVGIGAGAWWLHEDGRSKSNHPRKPLSVISNEYYDSKSIGVVSSVLGAACAAGGVIWLLLSPSSNASVTASPYHVAFSLRY